LQDYPIESNFVPVLKFCQLQYATDNIHRTN